jgi:hypothetical protein
MIEHAWTDVVTFMAAAPELAPAIKDMSRELQRAFGIGTLSLAATGLAADKGFAIFARKNRNTLILPVVDRDKFLAVVHGTKGQDVDTFAKLSCKTTHGVYACAEDIADLDRLGKGDVNDRLAMAGARGDIELAGTVDGTTFAFVGQLARGAFVVRGAVKGVPKELADVGWGRTKPHPPDDAAGWAMIDLEPLVEKLRGQAPRTPIVAGVTAAELVASINGVMHVVVPGGSNVFDARVPLRDAKPLATIIEHCDELPAPALIEYKNGKCRVDVSSLVGLAAEAWVDGDELRVRIVGMPGTNGTASAMSAIGAELARGEWSIAFWGRGSLLAAPGDLWKMPRRMLGVMPRDAMAAIRAMAMINEFGGALAIDGDTARFVVAARTAWSNPDDVVAKLVAIDPADVLAGKAGDAAKAIADAAPSSPFAGDFRAGTGGVMASLAPIGALSALAVPEFLRYTKKTKRSEAEANLDKIGVSAKRRYYENGAFPIGKAARLPAANDHCTADPAAFLADPIWGPLEFELTGPSRYRYDYESDGKTFTALASGDLDCHGPAVTYELRGSTTPAGDVQLERTVR